MSTAAQQRRSRLQRLVVTRPAGEAERWVHALNEKRWPAQALPLIDIGEPQSAGAQEALRQARAGWSQWDALMFVSSAAVKHFFGSFGSGSEWAPDGGRTRFWAPGPGTGAALAQALQIMGISPNRIDAPPHDAPQFDSESLWPVVSAQVHEGKRLLVVRGDSKGANAQKSASSAHAGQGREWLIRQCESLGASVQTCVAYERRAPLWSHSMRTQALEAAQPNSVWLLSSSEAAMNLRAGLPEVSWSQAAALTTHDRIAAVAREIGFGEVIASRPALPDVLRALELHWTTP